MSGQRNQVVFHQSGRSFYSPLPMGIARHPSMAASTVRVAAYIWSHDEKFRQSATQIAAAIGLHRDTVSSALDELQQFGWLVREIYTKPGNRKPSYEKWHVQRDDAPWTAAQVAFLAGEPAEKTGRFTDDAVGSVGRGCLRKQHIPAGSVGNIEIQEKYKVRNTSGAQGHQRNTSEELKDEAEQPDWLPAENNGVVGRGQHGRSLSVHSSTHPEVAASTAATPEASSCSSSSSSSGLVSLSQLASANTVTREESRDEAAARLQAELAEGPIRYPDIWDRFGPDEIDRIVQDGTAENHQDSGDDPLVLRLVDPEGPAATVFDPFAAVRPLTFAARR
jgi:hypothetical protein